MLLIRQREAQPWNAGTKNQTCKDQGYHHVRITSRMIPEHSKRMKAFVASRLLCFAAVSWHPKVVHIFWAVLHGSREAAPSRMNVLCLSAAKFYWQCYWWWWAIIASFWAHRSSYFSFSKSDRVSRRSFLIRPTYKQYIAFYTKRKYVCREALFKKKISLLFPTSNLLQPTTMMMDNEGLERKRPLSTIDH